MRTIFQPLCNIYQPILSNVSRSITRLYQCNPVINEKHVSVDVSLAYAIVLVNSSNH